MNRQRALNAIRLEPTDRIPHWEHFSCPEFQKAVTGIDPYEHPRLSMERFLELLPIDVGVVPESDDPIPKPPDDEVVAGTEAHGKLARWGTGWSWHWDWGKRFRTMEDVLSYSPLEDMDCRGAGVVEDRDYNRSVEDLAQEFQGHLDRARQTTGDRALVPAGFYNTIFMWPLLTFGWEHFLELGALHKGELKRLLSEFAERSRKVFRAWAMTDVEVLTSHDDICYQAGPVFSPEWLREFVYPYYEEFWSYLRAAGIKVVFISDGNVDRVADDIFACGADGIMSEPYTDWQTIARKHPDKILAGDGDNRILATCDRDSIERMVAGMAEVGKRCPGYFFCVGNHIPWNQPVDGVRIYFELCEKYGSRLGT